MASVQIGTTMKNPVSCEMYRNAAGVISDAVKGELTPKVAHVRSKPWQRAGQPASVMRGKPSQSRWFTVAGWGRGVTSFTFPLHGNRRSTLRRPSPTAGSYYGNGAQNSLRRKPAPQCPACNRNQNRNQDSSPVKRMASNWAMADCIEL